jgi:hypothetical protein
MGHRQMHHVLLDVLRPACVDRSNAPLMVQPAPIPQSQHRSAGQATLIAPGSRVVDGCQLAELRYAPLRLQDGTTHIVSRERIPRGWSVADKAVERRPLTASRDELREVALAQRPDVEAAQRRVEAVQRTLDLA